MCTIVPVCPHAGGVGLCEHVQHLQFWDYVSLTGEKENRMIEYVEHLHEHFYVPVVVRNGNYIAPTVIRIHLLTFTISIHFHNACILMRRRNQVTLVNLRKSPLLSTLIRMGLTGPKLTTHIPCCFPNKKSEHEEFITI
jgi:hypothetical protein